MLFKHELLYKESICYYLDPGYIHLEKRETIPGGGEIDNGTAHR